MKKILAEGHRGFCAKYPENTLISFEAALNSDVDAFEFDIWLSSDKVPVLMHDGNCLRTCGVNKHLRDMTLEEIKALDAGYEQKFGDQYINKGIQVPTLREMCELVHSKRPDMMLGVEIKEYTEETVDLSVAILKEFDLFDRAIFYAFDGPTIQYLKTKYTARTMGYPDFQMKRFTRDMYQYYDEIGLNMNIVRSEVFEFFKEKNLPMHMYCADTEEDVRLCIEKGAVLITANDIQPLLQVLKEMN